MLPSVSHPLRRAFAASALALALISPAQSVLASTLSINLQPRNAHQERALGAAITIYSVHRDLRSNTDVRQVGFNHLTQIHQSGGNSRGIIRQRGANHEVHLIQAGGNNNQVILQFGHGAYADVHQTGGQSGILIQFAH